MILHEELITLSDNEELGIKEFETYYVYFNTETRELKIYNNNFIKKFSNFETFNNFISKLSFITE